MSRRVPEFAVVTGVFLGLSVVVTGLTLGWSLYATVVLAALASYPFVGFGLVRDDDPAATIRPRWVLAAGVILAALGALGVLLGASAPTPGDLLFALLVALVLAAPAAAYATHYGASVNPLSARVTVLAGVIGGVGLALAGLLLNAPYAGTGAGVLVGLGGALYGTARGVTFDVRTKRRAAAVGALLGGTIAGAGVLGAGPPGEWLLVATATALVPSLYVALTADSTRRAH
jgi:hypothetical protein